MRGERIKNLLLCLMFGSIMIGSCVFYLVQRQKEEQEKAQKVYREFEVLLEGTEISSLMDDGNCLWVGTRDGIYQLDRDSGQEIAHIAEELQMIYASGIVKTEDCTVWVGHNGGVAGFLPDGSRIDFTSPDIPGGRVNTLWAEENEVWGGSMEGSFCIKKGDKGWYIAQILTGESGLACDPVNVICKVEDSIWYGAYLNHTPGGISIFQEDGSWQYVAVPEGLPHPYINALLPLSADQVLAATGQLSAGGLCVLEKKQGAWQVTECYGAEDNIPGEKVRWLYLDREGHLWITTEYDGLLLCPDLSVLQSHPLQGIVLTEENGLSDNEIKCIAETDQAIWLGGKYGLTRIDTKVVRQLAGRITN